MLGTGLLRRRSHSRSARSIVAVGALALSAATVLPWALDNSLARAAAPGPYPVGTKPVMLTQPANGGLGRLTPAADADTMGMFGPQVAWPVVPLHAVLTPAGHLVTYGSPVATARQGALTFDQWNPAVGFANPSHVQTPSMATYNAFCNSLQTLPDGRIVMVGGNSDDKTSMSTMLYDPATGNTAMGQPLNLQRWYATTMRLPDDRVLVLGGANYYNTGAYNNPNDNSGVGITPEIGSGTGAWTLLNGAKSTVAFGAAHNHWWYPRAFNAPNGQVFGVSGDQMWQLNPTGTGKIALRGTLPNSIGVSGAAVMYAPGKLLFAGGGQDFNQDNVTAINAATVIDINAAKPVVTSVAPMASRRNWLNLTALPTGEVLANGGTIVGTQNGASNSDYATEIWDPTTQTWRTGASAKRIRTYHSTSVLLPNGAVFTGGGGIPGPEDNLNAEIYYPPYLFTKDPSTGAVTWASRPTITSIAGKLVRGGSVKLGLGDSRTIKSVSLINAAQETHSVNQDQRRIPLTFTQNGAALTANVPKNRNALPPGNYLLSVVSDAGVPSPAQMVSVRNSGAGSVTVYEADNSTAEPNQPTADPGTVAPTIGSSVGIQPVNFPGFLVRHQNFGARLDPISATSSAADRADSSFVVRRGLASPTGISFESLNFPGNFLEVQNGAVRLVENDGTTDFAGNATFLPVTGLTGQNTSLQLYSDRTMFLRHQNFVLYAQPNDGSDGFFKDSTFSFRQALGDDAPNPGLLTVGAQLGLEPNNFPGYRVRHFDYRARLDQVSGTSDPTTKADSTFYVRAGLAAPQGVSFESSNFPGSFLVVEDGAVYLRQSDGSATFDAAATFLAQQGLTGTGTSFATYSDPTVFLRHQNFFLNAQQNDGSAEFAQDSSFTPEAGLG